jgi:branched-chain amino acid transport system permease protein
VILGGINTRLGPIVGAVFISLFPVVVNINPLWQEILFGGIFLAVIVFLPEGFVGLIARLGRLGVARWGRQRNLATPDDVTTDDQRLFAAPAAKATAIAGVPALAVSGVRFSYGGGVMALDGVDLVVASGTIHGLIGPNGSGKSTMVNLLSGLIKPQVGTITINGQQAENMAVWRRADIGVMRTFQTAVMVQELTTTANVQLGLYSRFPKIGVRSLVWPFLPGARRDGREMAAISTDALRKVGLGSRWSSSRITDIPHGVEQLTQLAAACVGEPSILILDEPLAGLSTDEVEQVSRILRSLRDSTVTSSSSSTRLASSSTCAMR